MAPVPTAPEALRCLPKPRARGRWRVPPHTPGYRAILRRMANTARARSWPLPSPTRPPLALCAGCGRDSVPPATVLCTLCTAHVATSTPLSWAAPTAMVDCTPTLTSVPLAVA